ncbi:MAG: preprotein translocase subunit YajC [Clostridia bacterium]|nr:preprotein translocase subunit YajC [Clostridia bacterium]
MFNLLAEAQQSSWLTWVILGVLLVGIIGMFVWQSISGKKKQKEAQEMMDNLKIGDRIKTIGGVCGFLVEVNKSENTIVIETGSENNKCYIKFDKGAIYQTGPANPDKPEVKEETAETLAEEKPAKKSKKAKQEETEEVVETAPAEESAKEE